VPNWRAAAPAPGAAAGGETIIQWAAPPCQGAARHPLSRRGGQPCPAPRARTLHIRKGSAPALHPPAFSICDGKERKWTAAGGMRPRRGGALLGRSCARGEALFGFSFPSRCKQAGERSSPNLRMPRQSHADFCSTDPAGGPPNREGRRASRRGQHAASSCGGRGACPPWRVTLHAKRIASYALPGCRFKCRCRRGGQGRLKRQGKQGCACAA